MPLAYPPYSSRPAAQSASSTIPVSNTRPGTGSTVGMNDLPTVAAAAAADPNKYLQEAQEIEITLGDRQEGYDADLVNLPERNTAARARPSIEPPDGAGPLLAATLPSPSRTLDENAIDHEKDKDGAGSDDPQRRFPSARRADRLGVRHHSSSGAAATKLDHARSKSGQKPVIPHGHVHGGGRRTTRRRGSGRKQRRKRLAWWERPRFLVIALVLIVAIGLGVGLGVGLSRANKNKRSNNNNNVGSTSNGGGINPPTRSGEAGGVPVSVSANDVVPMALPTAETPRPAVAAQTLAPAAAPPPPLSVVSLADLRRKTRKRS